MLDLDVAPHEDTYKTNRGEGRGGDEHVLERIVVGSGDSIVRWRADRVCDLGCNVSVDGRKVGLGLRRQIFPKLLGEYAGPDGAGDGTADTATDAREHALDGEDNGDVLVRRRSHDGHLLANDAGTAREGVDDLHEDDPADVRAGVTELDQQTDGENRYWHTEVQGNPLEPTASPDSIADGDGEEARSDTVDVADITCLPYIGP